MRIRTTVRRLRGLLTRELESRRRQDWPVVPLTKGKVPRVAVITVNYNTRQLLARLLFSLTRIPNDHVRVGPIVVVDNKSTDGSRELLKTLADRGVVRAILNETQMYHGPGLNQAMQLLLQARAAGDAVCQDIDYVFVVDSDVIITKGELFAHLIRELKTTGTCLAGEVLDNEPIDGGYAHVSSMLFDPQKIWRKGHTAFEEHGTPALNLQRSVVQRGHYRLHFPVRSEFYLVHLWSGTLQSICSGGDKGNRYFAYAQQQTSQRGVDEPRIVNVLQEFESVFVESVSQPDDPSAIAEACSQAARVQLRSPYAFAPLSGSREVVHRTGPGLVVWAQSTAQPCPAHAKIA